MRCWLRSHAWLLLVLAIAAFVMLWHLDVQPIVNFDEGIHGEVSWEMLAPRSPTRPAKLQRSGEGEVGVERGDWVSLSYMNGPYFRKPPGKIWMTSALFWAFGVSPWTLRLPSAIAGILTIMLVAWWVHEIATKKFQEPNSPPKADAPLAHKFQSRDPLPSAKIAGLLAGVILATSPAIFEHAFRTGEMDGVLTFFVTAALYCWWKGTEANDECRMTNDESMTNSGIRNSTFGFHSTFDIRHSSFRWLFASGAAIGLAVMTKSAAGILPLPIIALDWLVRYTRTTQRTVPLFHDREKGGQSALTTRAAGHPSLRDVLVLVLVLVLVAAPWHLAMTLFHGATFWNEYLGFHVVRRITEQLHNAGAGPLWYVEAFHRIFTPWTWWLVAALLFEFILSGARAKRRISHDGTNTPKSTAPRMGEILRHFVPQDKLIPQDKLLRLLLLWIAVTFIAFSTAQTKFAWYLLPMLPACAMLIAWFITDFLSSCRSVPTFHDREKWGHSVALGVVVSKAEKRMYTVLDGRPKLCTLLRRVFIASVVVTVGIASAWTYVQLATSYPPSPFPAVADVLRAARADGLVAYGFAWQEQPAGYFVLRTSLPQVKLSDGLSDAARTDMKLAERDRAWLITRTTELPEDLRTIVGTPHQIDGWSLWPRVAPQ